MHAKECAADQIAVAVHVHGEQCQRIQLVCLESRQVARSGREHQRTKVVQEIDRRDGRMGQEPEYSRQQRYGSVHRAEQDVKKDRNGRIAQERHQIRDESGAEQQF
jgi:hypothetical protein